MLAAALLTGPVGCAGKQVLPEEPPSAPRLASIAALGKTGVRATWAASDLRVTEPPKGWTGGFARGATAGAGVTLGGGVVVGAAGLRGGPAGLFWLLGWTAVGVALAPVGAAVGGIVGAVKAQPPEQVERRKVALVDAVTAADLPATLRDDVVRLGGEQSGHALVPVAGSGAETGDPEIGTVLDLAIRHVGLEARIDVKTGKPESVWADMDPELQLTLEVDANLLRAPDGTALYTRSFQALGAVEKFSTWAADDGRDFRDGLRTAREDVATQIANDVFPRPLLRCDDKSKRCAFGFAWSEMQDTCMPCEPAPEWCQGEGTEWTGIRCIRSHPLGPEPLGPESR